MGMGRAAMSLRLFAVAQPKNSTPTYYSVVEMYQAHQSRIRSVLALGGLFRLLGVEVGHVDSFQPYGCLLYTSPSPRDS